MKLSIVIIDDEPRAHKVLENYITRNSDIKLVGNFMNALTAYEFLKSNEVDLLFLDITMPQIDGFAFLRMLEKVPMVVFTTAHSQFALESYDYDAVDYLKKPISYERFTKALKKVMYQLSLKLPKEELRTEIQLKIDGEPLKIPFDTIFYFQSLGNYIKVITESKTYITQITTKEIEDQLPRELFIRIHKSFIINKVKMSKFTETEVIVGQTALPIGKTFKKYVRDSMTH